MNPDFRGMNEEREINEEEQKEDEQTNEQAHDTHLFVMIY